MLGAVVLAGALPAAWAATPRSVDPACTDGPGERFVDAGDTHREAIDCIAWWGVAQGVGGGRYDPEGSVSRDQMATFVANTILRSEGQLPQDPPVAFEDTGGTTHATAIDRLAAAGVVGGIGDGRYGPGRSVTRDQMATFLAGAWEHRTGEALPVGEDAFTDTDGNRHQDNIDRVAAAGIAGGVGEDRYDPTARVTRGQMATFLARFLAKLVADGVTDHPPADPVAPPAPPSAPSDLPESFDGAVIAGDGMRFSDGGSTYELGYDQPLPVAGVYVEALLGPGVRCPPEQVYEVCVEWPGVLIRGNDAGWSVVASHHPDDPPPIEVVGGVELDAERSQLEAAHPGSERCFLGSFGDGSFDAVLVDGGLEVVVLLGTPATISSVRAPVDELACA